MNLSNLRVWLVDDDASIRWVLERALRNGGMMPRAFDAAEPALVALRSDSPDVLVTDIRMPGQSGLELLKRIRETRPSLPVIVMTGEGDSFAAGQLPVEAFLTKPLEFDKFIEIVRQLSAFWQADMLAPVHVAELPVVEDDEMMP